MPEVNRFEIHGSGGVVRFDVVLEDAKVKKIPVRKPSAHSDKTLEDIQKKLQVKSLEI